MFVMFSVHENEAVAVAATAGIRNFSLPNQIYGKPVTIERRR